MLRGENADTGENEVSLSCKDCGVEVATGLEASSDEHSWIPPLKQLIWRSSSASSSGLYF